MRNKNLPGKEALRVEVFMPDMNPADARRAAKFVGTEYDLSLVVTHNGVHKSPGGVSVPAVVYQLFMHDGITPGGILIADSSQVTEYYTDGVTTDPNGDTITIVMSDGTEFVIDLGPILAKYDTFVVNNGDGTFTFLKNSVALASWINGSLYTIDLATNSLGITAGDGVVYSVPLDRWDFVKSADGRTLYIRKDGANYVEFYAGSTVEFEEQAQDGLYTLTIDGTAHEIDVGVVSIEKPTDTTFLATMTDGSTVGWAAPQNVIYLTNPLIYIRQDTGAANPPIVTQEDLTLENAFDSFDSVKQFLAMTQISGVIQIDARGSFGRTFFSSDDMYGADAIQVSGDEADISALTFQYGAGPLSHQHGFEVLPGVQVNIRDCTAENIGMQSGNTPSAYAGAFVSGGGVLNFAGTIRIIGESTDTQRVFWATNSGEISVWTYDGNNEPNATIVLDNSGALDVVFRAEVSSSIRFENTKFTRTLPGVLPVSSAVCSLDTGATIYFIKNFDTPYETHFVHDNGSSNMFNGRTFLLQRASHATFTRIDAVSFPNANVATWMKTANTTDYLIDTSCGVYIGGETRFGTTNIPYV